MRIIFLGTPEFAVPSLDALNNKYEIAAVVSQPDRERDRKGNIITGAVKKRASELGIPVYQFEKIRTDGADVLRGLKPDLMVTCAYGQILSQEILDIPPYGVLNEHGSILPYYRGSAPIQRALINGESETGITVMKTDAGMDSGDIITCEKIAVSPDDYVSDLYGKLSITAARLICDTIDGYVAGKFKPVKQDGGAATYAPMLKKEEAVADFNKDNATLRNILRGFGYLSTELNGTPLKIYRADLSEERGAAGEILCADKTGITVACGKGALKITELQLGGKKRMTAADFINGVRIAAGSKMGATE